MPMKVAQCLNCGQVKTILAKGLCKNCYQRMSRKKNKKPLPSRTCACGCGQRFVPKRRSHIYVNPKHNRKNIQRFNRRRFQKYLGRYLCPKCGQIGSLFAVWRKYKGYSKIIAFRMLHSRSVYSHRKYLAMKKKYGSARGRANNTTKHIRECYLC
jgi:predicted RNA-binding Zn-ribbon protein involved in translation (DUF1610 family)